MSKSVFIGATIGLATLLGSALYTYNHSQEPVPVPNFLEMRKHAEKEQLELIQKNVTSRKFLFHGTVFIPVSMIEGEDKKLLNDNGQELYPYKSYDEATGRYYVAYFLLPTNDTPSVKVAVPMTDDNGKAVYRNNKGE